VGATAVALAFAVPASARPGMEGAGFEDDPPQARAVRSRRDTAARRPDAVSLALA